MRTLVGVDDQEQSGYRGTLVGDEVSSSLSWRTTSYVRARVVILRIIINLTVIVKMVNMDIEEKGLSRFDVMNEVDPCKTRLVSYLRRRDRPTYATSQAIELRIVQHIIVRLEACFTLPLSGGVF